MGEEVVSGGGGGDSKRHTVIVPLSKVTEVPALTLKQRKRSTIAVNSNVPENFLDIKTK